MLKCITILLVIGLTLGLILGSALPAQATQWQQVAESAEGNIRQYIDTDSIRRSGQFVTVDSYVELIQATETETQTYTTEYDCERDRYRDIQPERSPSESEWEPIKADRLNEAARLSACAMS
jgi:type II secretory pathway pseudopilin PulG